MTVRKKNDPTGNEDPQSDANKQDLIQSGETGGNQSSDSGGDTEQVGADQKVAETVRVEFLTNVKYDSELFRAGERTALPVTVFSALSAAKAVRKLGE